MELQCKSVTNSSCWILIMTSRKFKLSLERSWVNFKMGWKLLRHFKKSGAFTSTCKLENIKVVKNGHHHIKTTEDEEIFWINAYPPIEKHYNKNLDTTIHLKNRGPSIKVPSISWFLIMNFSLCLYHQLSIKSLCTCILEIFIVIFRQTPFSLKCMSLDV